MQGLKTWWAARSAREVALYSVACMAFIFVAGIDIGRALFQATH